MKQPTIVRRLPSDAFDVFAREAMRQCRPFPAVVLGAARAFIQLPPEQRDAFTIGEPMPDDERAALNLKPLASVKPNRRKGAAL